MKLADIRRLTPNPNFDCRQTAFIPTEDGEALMGCVKNLMARFALRRTYEVEGEWKKPHKDMDINKIADAKDLNDFFFDEGRWSPPNPDNPLRGNEKKVSDNKDGTDGKDLMLPNQ